MRNLCFLIVLLTGLLAQQVFATSAAAPWSAKPCMEVVKACKAAGYKKEIGSNKNFWEFCMKPIILGQSVKGVTIDAATVKACRDNKIKQLQEELSQLQSVH